MGKLAFAYLSKSDHERLAKLRALGRDMSTTIHERNLANEIADNLEAKLKAQATPAQKPMSSGPFKSGDMVRVKSNHPTLYHMANQQGLQFKIKDFSLTGNRYNVYHMKDGKIIAIKPIHGDYLELA